MAKRRVHREPVVQPLDQSIKLIPLTQGQVTIVSASIYEWASQWNWYAKRYRDIDSFYAARNVYDPITSQQKTVFLHNEIFRDGKLRDHKNHDTLDNRFSNLRECSPAQNAQNRKRFRNNTSGATGVYFHARDQGWVACITVNGKYIHLGTFRSKKRAIQVRREAEAIYHKEFSYQRPMFS